MEEIRIMSEFSYETGRLDLPFVGHCTFAKSAVCLDWDDLDADVAVLGVPIRIRPMIKRTAAMRYAIKL